MTCAAIVCGNTVVLKPSSDSPTIAARFFDVLQEAGMPRRRRELLSRLRRELRQRHRGASRRRASSPSPAPKRSGSTSTQRAAQATPGQIWIKRTILEMGGKDSIIVDADCRPRRRRRRRRRRPPSDSGPEMLRLLARHHRRGYLRPLRRAHSRTRDRSSVGDPAENNPPWDRW